MKKKLAMALALTLVLAATGCAGGSSKPAEEPAEEAVEEAAEETEEAEAEAPAEEEAAAEVAVMSHEEYMAAAVDDEVFIETYVQAKQSWWEDKITVYAASEDGAYFIYNMACSEEDAAKLTPGTGIRVTGYKAEWSGEIEIAEGATFEFIDGEYVAEAADVTDLLGKDELIDHQNELVSFTDMTIEPIQDADGNEAAYLYNWDGSGEEGSDLYFNVSKDGQTYQFTVESYLTGPGTEVYEAVKGLNVGDTVDLTGFLYWYEGANPHITSVTVK